MTDNTAIDTADDGRDTEERATTTGGRLMSSAGRLLRESNLLILPTIILVILLSLMSDVFLTQHNLTNIARTASVFVIMGVGQTFVITSANIDLSIGSMLALVMGVTAELIIVQGLNFPLAMLFAGGFGAAIGVLNGVVVTKLKVPALLATLGGLIAYRGAIQQIMYGGQYVGFPEPFVILGRGMWGPIPVPVAIAAACAGLGVILLRYTRFGRYTIAIGSNEEAARRAGIAVDRWKIAVFAFQGVMVALASMVVMGRQDAANPNLGQLNELHVIAGVVLGGTLLFGGYGTIGGMVLGMLLIGILENGLLLAGAGFFWQQIFLGVLIVLAVASQGLRARMLGNSLIAPTE